jgi:tRNA(Ile)-lysidine synthase
MKKKSVEIREIVEGYIRRKNLFAPGEEILAAVSGGADSLCLLLVLKELGHPLRIAHFDHRLRPESDRDAEVVHRTADRLGIPFILGSGDVAGSAKENRMTVEEAARTLRYEFLLRTAREKNIPAVATGHTMDDQAETVLMNLLRGAGVNGISGIPPHTDEPLGKAGPPERKIRIARPLLCLTHQQTAEYCRRMGETPLEDPSNQDVTFTRNRIRGELIPLLREYNPAVVEAISRLADVARSQEEFVRRIADDIWKKAAEELAPFLVRIPIAVFRESPETVRRALVRRAVFHLKDTLEDLDFRHVERVLEFANAPSGTRRMDVALGVETALENDWLVFRLGADVALEPDWEGVELPCPGGLTIRHPAWKFEIAYQASLAAVEPPGDPWTVHLDPDRIRMPLILRRRRVGEKFFPAGMSSPVSLSDFLSSHHLPFSERDRWPLVCDSEGVVWIPGFRLKEGVAASKAGGPSLWIHIERFG